MAATREEKKFPVDKDMLESTLQEARLLAGSQLVAMLESLYPNNYIHLTETWKREKHQKNIHVST
jgi:hypothetical protein